MVHPVQSVVESLYAAGRCPRLHVNATCEGVVCPDFIREQWQERLIIDLDATYPLDLSFTDEGIGADLSFGGYVTRCAFPWKAIYVVADRATGRGIVLDQNMPESVRRSRHQPVTGPLPPGAELRPAPAPEPDIRPARVKPAQPIAKPSAVPQSSASSGSGHEGEAQRRRAAFKVIDGGG
ncbi:ClpXP protease specificity-enhancing factor SspB [Nannocystaceae bacterium ST9]